MNSLGCCLANFAHAEATWGNTTFFTGLEEFATNDCKLQFPKRCPKASGNIVGEIIINNIKWDWWITLNAIARAAILDKIADDIVAQLGSSRTDAELEVTQSTTTTQSSLGFTTYAVDPNSITVSITTGADANGANAAMQAKTAISDGAFALTQLNNAMPYEARVDVSNGVYADPSRSTVNHQQSTGGAAQATVSFGLLALLAAVAMLKL